MIPCALRPAFLGLAVLGLGLLQSAVEAQAPLMPEGDADGLVPHRALEGKQYGRFTDLRSGKTALNTDAEGRDLLAKAATWYVYRLTDPKYRGDGKIIDDAGKVQTVATMDQLVKEAHDQLLLSSNFRRKPMAPLKDNQPEYLKEFSKELTKCCREVLIRNSKPIVRVNVTRILAGVAEAGQEEAADTLLEILKSPRENEGVKLQAIHGLRELFSQSKAGGQSAFADAKREAKCILALEDYIARKPDLANSDPETLEPVRYIRREAIRALGKTRYPLVPKAEAGKGRTAWWLLKVARKDGLSPEPSLSEQIEAALGVCQLQYGGSKDVQLDYVAYHIGMLAVDLINQANRQKLGNTEVVIAAKLSAARLCEALDELKAQAKSGEPKAASYVEQVVDRAKDPLKLVWDGKDASSAALDKWLQANAPKNTTVYKGVADSTITAAAAKE